VAQSNGAFPYARTGGAVKGEDDPLDPTPVREWRAMLAAIRHLEEAVLGADWTEGIVLRYGAFYGPGTSLTQLLGARQPMRVPQFIGRLFAGDVGAVMMTELRGASNPRQSSSWDGAQRAGAGGRGSWRMTDRARLFDELRPVSFAIAYRVLGSVSEAEDVVQEALLRVHRALEAGEQIASPRAFLATVTTRLAINELRSARARREEYGAGGCQSRSSQTATMIWPGTL
jgi:Sigma-70 region 2